MKLSKRANYRTHALVKWAASHIVFESILIEFLILFFIWIKSEKYIPFNHFS